MLRILLRFEGGSFLKIHGLVPGFRSFTYPVRSTLKTKSCEPRYPTTRYLPWYVRYLSRRYQPHPYTMYASLSRNTFTTCRLSVVELDNPASQCASKIAYQTSDQNAFLPTDLLRYELTAIEVRCYVSSALGSTPSHTSSM